MTKIETFKSDKTTKISNLITDRLHKDNDLNEIEKIHDVLINQLPEIIVNTIVDYDNFKIE